MGIQENTYIIYRYMCAIFNISGSIDTFSTEHSKELQKKKLHPL